MYSGEKVLRGMKQQNIDYHYYSSLSSLSYITLQLKYKRFDHLSLFFSSKKTFLVLSSVKFSITNPSDFWHLVRHVTLFRLSLVTELYYSCCYYIHWNDDVDSKVDDDMFAWVSCTYKRNKKRGERVNWNQVGRERERESRVVVPGNLCFMESTLILDTRCLYRVERVA